MNESEIYRNIIFAIKEGNLLRLQELFAKYRSDRFTFKLDHTLLNAASSTGNLDVVKFLLRSNHDIDAKDENDETALYVAVKNDYLQISQNLIKYGASINSVNTSDCLTPIHVAARNGSEEMIQLLLNSHADIEAKDNKGYTALHIATQEGWIEIVRILLNNNTFVDATTIDDLTALHIAVKCKHSDIVKLLLVYKANLDSIDLYNCRPINYAIKNGSEKVLNILLEFNADVNFKDKYHITPIHLAIRLGHLSIAKVLLQNKANVNVSLPDGDTPLFTAIDKGYTEIVSILLKCNSDVNFKNDLGETPLHFAIRRHSKMDIGKLLLKYGAEVDFLDFRGFTPLLTAVLHCGVCFITLLLENNADVNKKGINGYTAFELAAIRPNWTIIRVLSEHIIKMKASGMFVSEKNLQLTKDFSKRVKLKIDEFKCEEEIKRMKCRKIIRGTISLYDILTNNLNQIASYASNKDAVQMMDHIHYKSEFPIYGKVLRSQFSKGMERKVLLEKLNLCSNNFLRLPEDCINRITSYIINPDLRNLIKACMLDNERSDAVKHKFCNGTKDRRSCKKRKT